MQVGKATPASTCHFAYEKRSCGLEEGQRTFTELASFPPLVVNSTRPLLNELVTFHAEVDNLGTLHSEFNQFLCGLMHNICGSLCGQLYFIFFPTRARLTLYFVNSAALSS